MNLNVYPDFHQFNSTSGTHAHSLYFNLVENLVKLNFTLILNNLRNVAKTFEVSALYTMQVEAPVVLIAIQASSLYHTRVQGSDNVCLHNKTNLIFNQLKFMCSDNLTSSHSILFTATRKVENFTREFVVNTEIYQLFEVQLMFIVLIFQDISRLCRPII